MAVRKSFIVNLCLFFALFPFISPYPLESDMQPVAAVIGFSLFLHDFLNKKLTLNKMECTFFIFCIWSNFYLGTQGRYLIEDRFTLFLGFFVYYALSKNFQLLKLKVIFFCILFNFLCAISNILISDVFITIANQIVRKVKVTTFDVRGITGLSPESSFMSVMAICHAVLYFHLRKPKIDSKIHALLVFFISIFIIYASKSGTGILMILILSVIYFLSLLKRLTLPNLTMLTTLTLIIFVIFNTIEFIPSFRGLQLLQIAIENPSLLLTDGSMQERLIGLHVGLISVINFPFGTGAGSYLVTASYLDEIHGISKIYPLARSGVASNVSGLGTGMVEFGVLFPLAFLCLAHNAVRQGDKWLIPLFVAFIMLTFSFSVGFPLTYLMFALASYRKVMPVKSQC